MFRIRKNLSSRARLSWTSLWLCALLAPAAWLTTGLAAADCTAVNGDSGTAYFGCVDMLQGRRVLSRRDWLVVNAPAAHDGSRVTTNAIVYATEADTSIPIPGIGQVITSPELTHTPSSAPCDSVAPTPFPARSVTARLPPWKRILTTGTPKGPAPLERFEATSTVRGEMPIKPTIRA